MTPKRENVQFRGQTTVYKRQRHWRITVGSDLWKARRREILLNCIDKDGTNSGFDIELINHIRDNVTIPVITSSGADKVDHLSEVFEKADVASALAAGIFHWKEIRIEAVREHIRERGIETR